jgi:hypothetical protein
VAGQQYHLRHPGEPRGPAALAILVAIALYTLLPNRLLIGPRFVVPVLEILLFIPIVAANPRRLTKQTKVLRRLDIALLLLIAASNATALVLLIHRMLDGSGTGGSSLLLAAGQIWLTNVLVFALAYWTLDRGGPVSRIQLARPRLPVADFRFPQDEDQDAIIEVAKRSSGKSGWVPGFVDYLYVSVTNSSAFSPTDTMPLSPRAKLLMALESVSALVIAVLVIAYAVGQLK